jgi:hypothetical protein
MSCGGCGHGRDHPGGPAAYNHEVILTAIAVDPIRRVTLLNRLLVVTVSRE